MIREAFNETLNRYRFTAKALSEKSGVSENHISAFKRGVSEMGSKKLEALIEAMDELAPGSKQYFCSQLASSCLTADWRNARSSAKAADWRSLILAASPQDIEEILRLLAEQWSVIQQKGSSHESTNRDSAALAL